jgi:4-amino-4-deoxy-L-arabinose transferase-like glycosyltransferase
VAAPTSTPQAAADHRRGRLLLVAAFALPLLLYLATASASVQLDDGAEFVLCARDGGTAHPPGFPAWVALARVWCAGFGFLPAVTACCVFVATAAAAGIALCFLAFDSVLARPFAGVTSHGVRQWSAFAAALAVASSATVWQWSNTAEVYSLQLAATALALFGLSRDDGASRRWRVITGLGLGIGLANHHLSAILLLPFLPPLVALLRGISWPSAVRALLPAGLIALGTAAAAYAWLALTAGAETAFAFGQPDTWSRLWHHVSGGFFGDSFGREGVDYEGRAAVFAAVLVRHFGLFAVPFALGVAAAVRRGRGLSWLGCGYLALYLLVQLPRMHTPNMDSALLPALAVTGLLTALGCARLAAGRLGLRGMVAGAAAALGLQLVLNFPASNRAGYEPGTAVLADLDAALPERSILLVTNWELLTITWLARTDQAWRPDVIVLHSNLKGTHCDLLARTYPDLHAAVRPEYEAFLAAIAAVDPDYVYTDYSQFATEPLQRSYLAMIKRLCAVARAERRPLLCDRGTFRDWHALGLVGARVGTCGPLFLVDGDEPSRPFPAPGAWLAHPFLAHDLCAIGLLHEYVTVSRNMAGYWNSLGNRALAAPAAAAAARLEAIWTGYLRGKPAPRR